MKVLLFNKYGPQGASSRLRSYQYIPFLKQEGIRVDISPLFDNQYLNKFFNSQRRNPFKILYYYFNRARRINSLPLYDLIWIEYELFPWLPAFIENKICIKSSPFIVDYDDAVFHRYDLNPYRLVRKTLCSKIDWLMRSANTVIAGNSYIAERAFTAGASKVVQIPTAIDLKRYRCSQKCRKSIFAIGWIGTPYTARYLKIVEPVFKELACKYAIKVVAIGAGNISFTGFSFRSIPWTEESEAENICSFDVGIMPLLDEPFERGKCGYKLIQYMACGIPVVASPVGTNKEIVKPEFNGFLASSEKQWYEAIQRLILNPEISREMGIEGRRLVEKSYCIQVTASKLSQVIKSAARQKT